MPNGGRKAFFPELEKQLNAWILSRNEKGLRVKDKFIRAHMRNLRDEALSNPQSEKEKESLKKFDVSPMWLQRFKCRYNFVSRRETSCRTLPVDFVSTAKNFLADTRKLISDKKITRRHIYNFDQVPRYIELHNGSTITKKGTKNVTLKKSSSSHKRFSFTPLISATGEFVALHLLFSNLKNKPKVNNKCIVDVNKCGMWSQETIKNFFHEIAPKIQSPFKEPCLIIMDSYSAHLKYWRENNEDFAKNNIYFAIIPPSLTGLLQPLDVAVNRAFQQNFDDIYTVYLEKALGDPSNRTKQGNVKVPSYACLADWCSKWAESMSKSQVSIHLGLS